MDDRERSSIAFLRIGKDSNLVCACNFTPVRYDNFLIALPEEGELREILNSDDERFGGSGVKNAPVIKSSDEEFIGMPCSAEITLPPMSAVYFEYVSK